MAHVHIDDSGPDYWESPDGEHVRFSRREWNTMMEDPCFYGYSCHAGHAIREDDPGYIANGCPTCFELGEMQFEIHGVSNGEPDAAALRAFERYAAGLRDFPLVTCGCCKQQHVGRGAVRRCYADSGRFDR